MSSSAPITTAAASDSVPIPDVSYLSLPHKPSARVAYRLFPSAPSSTSSNLRLVFLNGIGLPQDAWLPTIRLLLSPYTPPADGPPGPPFSILTYDRFGQGATTDRDPADADAADPKHGHDVSAIAHDLHALLQRVEAAHPDGHTSHRLLLVSNSLGGATARLYAQHYPSQVCGYLFLDSVLANSNFVDIVPDPDAASFDASTLPPPITPEQLRLFRQRMMVAFHPSNGSGEGTSRRNLASLLPHADAPPLPHTPAGPPLVTVVGHGFQAFAAEATKQFGIAEPVVQTYMNPHWHAYNEGLCRLTEVGRSRGPIEAVGAGHFVQKDRPDLVADEIRHLVHQLSTQ